ncbi:transcriptional regulator, TetR family [Paenibacillus sophorae]|uniref:Transcriptional regulator, TetR family n=2 Tax=Paenibacillus sophorae TaxID=1333845 RepID=A0A1H8M4E7_9BACL|nr:TetR/AcrR family transcriptional regulator [Paenibacillus sophorae]SEO12209.1 transcriptional regulator, TetR family [Paenibacillus sophorae]
MKKMNGFEKRAAKIRYKIMRATLEMLKTWEPKRMRIADIAKAAGVSQVTIYNYFGSKEALIEESLKDFVDQAIDGFEEVLNQKRSIKEIVEYTIIQEKETYAAIPPSLMKKMMLEDQEMFRYIQQRYEQAVLPLMIRMLEEGKARNEISSKVSVNSVLIFMNFYMQNAGEMLEIAQKQDNRDAFLEEMVHIFFYGICGREE